MVMWKCRQNFRLRGWRIEYGNRLSGKVAVFQHRLKVETLRHLLIKIGSSKTFHTLHVDRFKFAFSQGHLFVKNRSVRSAFGNCLRSMALNFEQISVLLHAGFICKVVSKSQVQPRISFENPGALAEELIGKCPVLQFPGKQCQG